MTARSCKDACLCKDAPRLLRFLGLRRLPVFHTNLEKIAGFNAISWIALHTFIRVFGKNLYRWLQFIWVLRCTSRFHLIRKRLYEIVCEVVIALKYFIVSGFAVAFPLHAFERVIPVHGVHTADRKGQFSFKLQKQGLVGERYLRTIFST